jgi:metallo-beta-lactamase family protein
MQLSFLGGATTVTSSQYLLDTGDARVLIGGMFQGSPNETIRNRLPFAYDPKEIDALPRASDSPRRSRPGARQ